VREPSHRLTQHKRRGGRSLLILRDPEEAPTLFFKGSKPGAATAGWSLFCAWLDTPIGERFDDWRATRAPQTSSIEFVADARTIDRSLRDERCVNHGIRGKCSTREVDLLLAELWGRQHGVVARWQLMRRGVSRGAIDDRIGRRLHPIHRGVYAVGYPVSGIKSRWMAAVLAAGPNAVLSHRSAAQLWGLMSPSGHRSEVTRPTFFRSHSRIDAHRSVLPDDERTLVDRIPVTTVPRTILDLAAVASQRQVERALNEVEVRQLTDRLSIPDLLERYPRRRGTAVLRDLLDDGAEAGGVTRNDFEEAFVTLLDSHGLPRPRFNADVAVAGRFCSADCLWQRERLIVELDGRDVHRTRKAFESDRERDRLLMVEGWRVVRVTWRQLRDQRALIASDLRKVLTRGRALH
jgi:very-short-patch-repair endonuclease/predicted transcriptional regulator of viral defense system